MALSEIQSGTVTLLQAVTALSGITIVASLKGDLQTTLDESLNSQLGRCIVVSAARGPVGHAAGKLQIDCRVEIRVFENVLITRAAGAAEGPTAEAMVEAILLALRGGQVTSPPCFATGFELEADLDDILQYRVDATRKLFLEATA